MRPLLKAHLALLTVGIIYGLNYSIAKVVLNGGYIGSSGFILFRVGFAVLFFTILLGSSWRTYPFTKAETLRLILCGLFGVATNQLLFFKGLELTVPINASLIMTNTPILVLVLSVICGLEVLKPIKIFSVLLGSLGAVMLITNGFSTGLHSINSGDIYILLNASSYAIYLILVKRLLTKYKALEVVRWAFCFGLVFVFGFGFPEAIQVEWLSFTPKIWAAFAFVLIFTTGFAYWLNASALEHVTPSTVSMYIYTQPLIAAIVGQLMGQHELNAIHAVSGFLIFIAVFLVSYPKLKRTKT